MHAYYARLALQRLALDLAEQLLLDLADTPASSNHPAEWLHLLGPSRYRAGALAAVFRKRGNGPPCKPRCSCTELETAVLSGHLSAYNSGGALG